MSTRFDFWTHGVATILEFPELAKLIQYRTDVGTVVEQDANTEGWFHIPLTTPTVMEDDVSIFFRLFALKAKVNDNAKVDLIHVRRGTDLIFNQSVAFVGKTIDQAFDIPDTIMSNVPQAGLALSIHVQFLTGTPRGRIEFQGAGAVFS